MGKVNVLERVAGPMVLLSSLAIAWIYWDGRHVAADNAERDRAISEAARLQSEESALRTDCQLDFDRKVIRAVTITRKESVRASTATQDVFQTVGRLIRHPPVNAAQQAAQTREFVSVFDRYDQAAERLAKARARNPFPTFPDCERIAARKAAALPTPGPTSSPSSNP